MIDITAFECEITDPADVFVRRDGGCGELFLHVVLPSFCFRVRLSKGNAGVLGRTIDDFLGEKD